MDTLFHNRISQLETSLGDVRTEVQLAVADVLDGEWLRCFVLNDGMQRC